MRERESAQWGRERAEVDDGRPRDIISSRPGRGSLVTVFEFFESLKSDCLFEIPELASLDDDGCAYRKGSNYTFRYRLMSRHTAYCERTGGARNHWVRMKSTRKTSEKTAHVDNFWTHSVRHCSVQGFLGLGSLTVAKESLLRSTAAHYTLAGVALFLHYSSRIDSR